MALKREIARGSNIAVVGHDLDPGTKRDVLALVHDESSYMQRLLTDPIGQILLMLAIALNVLGGFVNSKLVKVEGWILEED